MVRPLLPSRNQRSRRLKVKYVLQICLLSAISIWLIYQMKHSHDRKRELDDVNNRGNPTFERNGVVLMKHGRKDLREADPENAVKYHNDDEEDDDREGRDDQEVAGRFQDSERKSSDENPSGDLYEEESIHTGGEGSGLKKENEISESEIGKGVVKDGESDEKNIREAREEHYKGDDASSAVGHDSPVRGGEIDKLSGENFTQSVLVKAGNIISGESMQGDSKESIITPAVRRPRAYNSTDELSAPAPALLPTGVGEMQIVEDGIGAGELLVNRSLVHFRGSHEIPLIERENAVKGAIESSSPITEAKNDEVSLHGYVLQDPIDATDALL